MSPLPRFVGSPAVARAARLVVLALLTASAPSPCAAESASGVPTIRIGDGRSAIVEYDRAFTPLRRFVGLVRPTDVTPLADGSMLLVDEDAHRVLEVGADGAVAWNEQIGNHPIRARPRRAGGLVVTGLDQVVLTDEHRAVVWERHVPLVRAAVELANGNLLMVYNGAQGWLEEITLEGEVRFRSRPSGFTGADGRWVAEDPAKWYQSVFSLDVAPDGTVLTTNFDEHQIRLLSPSYDLLWQVQIIRHVTDTRIGPHGEYIATSPEDYAVWFKPREGDAQRFTTEQRPLSANVTPRGTLLVGLFWEPEGEALYASEAKRTSFADVRWWRRGVPVPLIGFVLSIAFAVAMRWKDRSPSGPSLSSKLERDLRARSGAPQASQSPAVSPAASPIAASLLVVLFAASAYAAWYGIGMIDQHGYRRDAWWFAAGCLGAGIALRLLDAIGGGAASFTRFVPEDWPAPLNRGDRARTLVLLGLALAFTAVCIGILRLHAQDQAIAVAAWIAAQVLILAAAYPPIAARERVPRAIVYLAAVVVVAALATRFWRIGEYPDYVHHDHGMFGHEVVRAWRGDWTPFFTRVYSVGRPWLIPVMGLFDLFGPQYWILRFTAAASGVVAVWATYLLGGALYRPRVGLIAAALVAVNHVLLLYSRQPYVIDPVAPFVLALWAASVGLARGSRFHWCLAGVLAAWSLLGYYASTTYAVVGAALLAYIGCVHPRTLWRVRSGVLWMLAGAAIGYLPMAANLGESITVQRASSVIVLLNPDGSIHWDAQLWAEQIGRSFGSLLHWYSGEYAWGVSAGRSVCLPIGACLFGIGLVYLTLRRWTPATFLLLVWPAVCIFLGSATLPSPPTPYHFLAAVIPVLIVSAVALDRVLAVADALPRPALRLVPRAAALALLGALVAGHLEATWSAVSRPPPGEDGQPVYRAGADVLATRFIREHPRYRYYLVRERVDISAASAMFRFFAADSDLSDLSSDLSTELPVPPVDDAEGAAFLVLPTRAGDRAAIRKVYPAAREVRIHSYDPGSDLWVVLVDAGAVREAWDRAQSG